MSVEVIRTSQTLGPLYEDLCAIRKYLTKEEYQKARKRETSNTYSVGEINVKTISSVDPEHIYRLVLSNKFFKRNDVSFEFTQTGELKGGKLTQEDLTAKVMTQTLGSLASLGGSIASKGESTAATRDEEECRSAKISESAKLVADEIAKLISSRTKVISSIETMEQSGVAGFKLERINARLNELFAMFVGSTQKKTIAYSFLLDPDTWADTDGDGVFTSVDLFWLDKINGVRQFKNDANQQGPWVDDFDTRTLSDSASTLRVAWVLPPRMRGCYSTIEGLALNKAGLVYRIPARGELQIFEIRKERASADAPWVTKADLLAVKELNIPQKGSLGMLPNFKATEFTLLEGTGALLKISGSTKSIDPSQIDVAGKALIKAKEDLTPAATPDPRDKIISDLEKQVKIKELEDKLKTVAP